MCDGRTDRDMVATELLVDPFSSLAGLADAVIVVHARPADLVNRLLRQRLEAGD
jgi:hypothetical protein